MHTAENKTQTGTDMGAIFVLPFVKVVFLLEAGGSSSKLVIGGGSPCGGGAAWG